MPDLGSAAAGGDENAPPPPSQPKSEGSAAFLRAARGGNLDKVLDFLKAGTDINTCNANGLNALHLASKEGHATIVNELLRRGANVDAATKKGNTSMHIAALAGQKEIIRILVEHGGNVNCQSGNGFTPLYMAAQENHLEVVNYLLSNGANQSLATEDGFTPLAVALQQGHDRVVALLLENDSRGKVRLPALHIAAKKDDTKAATLLLQNEHNPDVVSKSGFTPLHIAAHYGNEAIANMLLEKGANVNYQARHSITPLHVAAKWGRANMVTLLLAHGAVIDCKTRDMLTPLHCAARSGHDQVVDLLIEKGAAINAKTKNGLSPLHMAAQGDHVDSARILLYHRAPVDDVTVDYLTPLHVAAHCGHVRVAKLLLDRQANPNARALNGFTPLHIACKKNRIKVIELLLKYMASIEATTESGLTPLHVASFMGCMNIVIFLLQQGANVDVTTVRGETPLHLAARANQTDIVRILLRNNATVDARARENQTPLHIASRLGNQDIVMLLLQGGADPNAATRDQYTPLHIAAKEGQEEIATILLDQGAEKASLTKKGFTPLHLAAKYGNLNVARLLLDRGVPVDVEGKNQVTPLHVAAHYNHEPVALLLLERKASPHAAAKNGYTPLHIAAKKNQMEIASTLLDYKADPGAESKAGFTPLHLAAQEGHQQMASALLEHGAQPNARAKNGLTPMHLCAQEDRVPVAEVLVAHKAQIDPETKAGYTPLHVAAHFGQMNMVRFLLGQGAKVDATTKAGYTPLHQASQQGHNAVVKLLLDSGASPNVQTTAGHTPLSIAQRLGYVTVVETLRTVTETTLITETTTTTEERYAAQVPETVDENVMMESEDEGEAGEGGGASGEGGRDGGAAAVAEANGFGEGLMKGLEASAGSPHAVHSMFHEEGLQEKGQEAPEDGGQLESLILQQQSAPATQLSGDDSFRYQGDYAPDNVDLNKTAVHTGFLISFMVDARGGAMRGCRHSGVRIIVPPRKAPMPMRITCRYLRKDKLANPPPLVEGEALASRVLEMGPAGAKFLGPVIIEVPHFASLRGREREIVILRSDDGQHWKEHQLEATEDAVQEVLNESFDAEELQQLEDLNTTRITRILTNDFPQYFAIVTRIRQEVHAVGPDGGMIVSTVVPQVQAIFPEGSLTKTIKVSVQAHAVPQEAVNKLLGNRVAVSPIVTVEPRRRKFHKPITLCIPLPQSSQKGMITQYSGQPGQEPPTLRLLCSITGGQNPAQWEDITGTTQLTFAGDVVSFTTTVSARFWLMDCQTPREAARMAQELYNEAIVIPYMAKFVIFARRAQPTEGQLRVFCMTDDKEDKTLEKQEHFTEIAKSRDVEVLGGKPQWLEFAGNVVPVTKSGDQLSLSFIPFQENRLPFNMRVRERDDPEASAGGRVAFMKEAKSRGSDQHPICTLAITLPDYSGQPMVGSGSERSVVPLNVKYPQLAGPPVEEIQRADVRVSDVAREVGPDWQRLARSLEIPDADIRQIRSEYPGQEALTVLRIWIHRNGPEATGNALERALAKIGRPDVVQRCLFNVQPVRSDQERYTASRRLVKEQPGRGESLDVSYDEREMSRTERIPEETHRYSRTTTASHGGRRSRSASRERESPVMVKPATESPSSPDAVAASPVHYTEEIHRVGPTETFTSSVTTSHRTDAPPVEVAHGAPIPDSIVGDEKRTSETRTETEELDDGSLLTTTITKTTTTRTVVDFGEPVEEESGGPETDDDALRRAAAELGEWEAQQAIDEAISPGRTTELGAGAPGDIAIPIRFEEKSEGGAREPSSPLRSFRPSPDSPAPPTTEELTKSSSPQASFHTELSPALEVHSEPSMLLESSPSVQEEAQVPTPPPSPEEAASPHKSSAVEISRLTQELERQVTPTEPSLEESSSSSASSAAKAKKSKKKKGKKAAAAAAPPPPERPTEFPESVPLTRSPEVTDLVTAVEMDSPTRVLHHSMSTPGHLEAEAGDFEGGAELEELRIESSEELLGADGGSGGGGRATKTRIVTQISEKLRRSGEGSPDVVAVTETSERLSGVSESTLNCSVTKEPQHHIVELTVAASPQAVAGLEDFQTRSRLTPPTFGASAQGLSRRRSPDEDAAAIASGSKTPPSSPQGSSDKLTTDQEKESMEEGWIDGDGNVVVSKKVTRVVTTTRTVYDDGDGEPEVEVQRTVEERELDPTTPGNFPEF